MLLLLLMSFLLFQKEDDDALLAARINQLFHLVLTTDDKKQEAAAEAELKEIFRNAAYQPSQPAATTQHSNCVFGLLAWSHRVSEPNSANGTGRSKGA